MPCTFLSDTVYLQQHGASSHSLTMYTSRDKPRRAPQDIEHRHSLT
jgi:hypothetical protein